MEREPYKLGKFAEFKFEDKYPSEVVRNVWGAWADRVWQNYYYLSDDRSMIEEKWNPKMLKEKIFDRPEHYFDGKQRRKTFGAYMGGFAYFCQTLVCACSVHKLITEQIDNRVTLGQIDKLIAERDEGDIENYPAEKLLKWGRAIEQGNFNGVLDRILTEELLMDANSGLEKDINEAWKRGSIAAFKYAKKLSMKVEAIYNSNRKGYTREQ